ncbi:MAG: DUF1385 domain-containing protein [Clostridiales bacterium]|nr:DUF1385 domain-containing protein [Candidatus Equinaster intestinalis]
MAKQNSCNFTSIGGQALIEGVMMRGPEKTALAVRLPDGNIDLSFLQFSSITKKFKFLKLPVIRGVVNFIESLIQGYKALSISAEKSGFADTEEDKAKEKTDEDKKKESTFMAIVMIVATVLAVILSVFLFVYLPALAFDLLEHLFGSAVSGLAPLIEGIIKVLILVAYMALVSLEKDIKRVFSYHGAEHKTIFCYEAGEELTVENVRKQKRFHPRCGTSFLILMLLVSIIVSFLITFLFPSLREITILWVAIKILLIPVICGLGYELIKVCGRHDNLFTRIISAPGVWLQHITTKEPDDSMIEIAIASMQAVIPENAEDAKW